jgi:hypothetical protein
VNKFPISCLQTSPVCRLRLLAVDISCMQTTSACRPHFLPAEHISCMRTTSLACRPYLLHADNRQHLLHADNTTCLQTTSPAPTIYPDFAKNIWYEVPHYTRYTILLLIVLHLSGATDACWLHCI